MPNRLDARLHDGQLRFRLFSTVSDSYTTDEMTEEQLFPTLVEHELLNQLSRYIDLHERDLVRVKRTGTTDHIGQKPNVLNEPWSAELTDASDEVERDWSAMPAMWPRLAAEKAAEQLNLTDFMARFREVYLLEFAQLRTQNVKK
jgi:hypothetical protein